MLEDMPHLARVSEVHFPLACPRCRQIRALPYSAATTSDVAIIDVAMRCGDCGHVWRFGMQSGAGALNDPDRALQLADALPAK